jgi:Flp pilus assembly protein TadG
MQSGKKFLKGLVSREDGVVGVEMVILFPLLALIVVGLVEFGHLWFVRQTLTNASREGARAAVVYYTGADRAAWVTSTAQAAVATYLAGTRFPEACPPAEVAIPAGAASGNLITVTVTSPNGLLLLPKLFSAESAVNKIGDLSAETTMRLE